MSLQPYLFALAAFVALNSPLQARSVWRCVRDGTLSLATAPEPGSQCKAQVLDDNAANLPNLWGSFGSFTGTLYRREQDGAIVYSTRKLPGSIAVQRFTVVTPPASPAHIGLGEIGKPKLAVYRSEFATAARSTGVDEALLRAVAHAESDFAPTAVSDKGAKGVMQLMPEVIDDYGVRDPFSAQQSILAGARYLKALEQRYGGDAVKAAAAYNAGAGAVERYGGVPPYAETQQYVAKVSALYASYRQALGMAPLASQLTPAL
jgi:hypothetical protein